MESIIINDLWEEWIIKTNEKFFRTNKAGKIKHSFYKHFSYPPKDIEEIKGLKEYFLDPLNIKKHNFSPLIAFLKKTPIFSREKIVPTISNKKKINLKRSSWKIRPLMYADHIDSLIYSWYSYLLNNNYENYLKEHNIQNIVSAYRLNNPGITNASIAGELFDFIHARKVGESWDVLLFDIQKFYDTLDPSILKKHWAAVLGKENLSDDHYAVYKSVIDYGVVQKGHMNKFLNDKFGPDRQKSRSKICTTKDFHHIKVASPKIIQSKGVFLSFLSPIIDSEKPASFQELTSKPVGSVFYKGIPQGLTISPVLANIYMIEFDKNLARKLEEVGGFLRRYADDVAIVCPSIKTEEVKQFVMDNISNPKVAQLKIQDKKTEHFRILDGKIISLGLGKKEREHITYLGITLQDGKTHIKSGTISKGYQRINRIIATNFGRKKQGKKRYSKDRIVQKVLGGGIFHYVRLCTKSHSLGMHNQFSKANIRKYLCDALLKYND